MPNKQKKGTPKGNGRKNLEKSLQDAPTSWLINAK
jgi:hypothetical protein